MFFLIFEQVFRNKPQRNERITVNIGEGGILQKDNSVAEKKKDALRRPYFSESLISKPRRSR